MNRTAIRRSLDRAARLNLVKSYNVLPGGATGVDLVEITRTDEALAPVGTSERPDAKGAVLTLDLKAAYYYLLGLADGYRATVNARVTPRRRKGVPE